MKLFKSLLVALLICAQSVHVMNASRQSDLQAMSPLKCAQLQNQLTKEKDKVEAPSISKQSTRTIRNVKVAYGVNENIGGRDFMEDDHRQVVGKGFAFFGVFDGHGGSAVAHFAAAKLYENCNLQDLNDDASIKNALQRGFLTTHDQLTKETLKEFLDQNKDKNFQRAKVDADDQGCTAVVAYVRFNELFVANAGDSRAVLCRAEKAFDLSEDHKPTTMKENARIKNLNVKSCGVIGSRVGSDKSNSFIAVSRSLGDKHFNPCMSPEPEITQTTLQGNDQFLILACDGIWDVLSSQGAVDVVKRALQEHPNDYTNAARALVTKALELGTTDNLTVIVVGIEV